MPNRLIVLLVGATTTRLPATITLILSIVAAGMFTIGWRLAVQKRFAAHRWLQTAAVSLNAILVLTWMVYSFVRYLAPGLPARLDQMAYAVTTAHAFVGVCGLVFGSFIVLRANELVPAGLRFRNYKAYMRTSYSVYMLATLMGITVYAIVYVAHIR